MCLPAKNDPQVAALVPCKDIEQRMLDRTFYCPQTRGSVPAASSTKIPVRTNQLAIILYISHNLSLSR